MTDLVYKPTPTTTILPNPRSDGIVAVTTQDVEPIVDHAAELRKLPQKSDWGRHVASVPNNLINGILADLWAKGLTEIISPYHPMVVKIVKEKLDNGEWAKFRVDDKVSGSAFIGYTKDV